MSKPSPVDRISSVTRTAGKRSPTRHSAGSPAFMIAVVAPSGRRRLPHESIRVGERPAVGADEDAVRSFAVLVDTGVLGGGPPAVERELDGRSRVVELDVLAAEA